MNQPSSRLIYSILILVQILFGLNFMASKVIVTDMAPSMWAMIRFLTSAIILGVYAFFTQKDKFESSFKYFNGLFWFGLLGMGFAQLAFLEGIKRTTSINTSILISTIPIITLLIVLFKGVEKLTKYKIIGFSLAAFGVFYLRDLSEFTLSNSTFIGDLLVLSCATSTAIFFVYSKKFLEKYNYMWCTVWMFFFSAVQIGIYILLTGQTAFNTQLTGIMVSAMGYSIIGATLLTYFLSNWALVWIESSNVSLFIYLQPIVATIVGWLILNEEVTLRTITSCFLIICGFLITLFDKRLKETSYGDTN